MKYRYLVSYTYALKSRTDGRGWGCLSFTCKQLIVETTKIQNTVAREVAKDQNLKASDLSIIIVNIQLLRKTRRN